jgi:hypothetical protein
MRLAFACILLGRLGYAADVCNSANFPGVYGFVLSGTTTISGESKPVVSVARLVFESPGKVSGTSSVNFGGLFLGNPVTGQYTLKSDCSLGWTLQDDSGNSQSFAGKLSLDGRHVDFGQTDPGSPQRGVMVRTAESCPSSDFRGRYRIRITGTRTDMETGKASGVVNMNGAVEADGNTGLRFAPDRDSPSIDEASYEMEGACLLRVTLTKTGQTMNFRAIVANEGKEVMGIETDAGATVLLRATRE